MQPDHELVLKRTIDAPVSAVWRCWAEPELKKQWFCPRPWTTPVIEEDFRTGGDSFILMQGPEGEEHPNHGVFLEVVPQQKIVMTDAFVTAWVPSKKPFMTMIVTLKDQDGKTHYDWRALHWTAEDRKTHEEMGFHEGWGMAASQMEDVARSL